MRAAVMRNTRLVVADLAPPAGPGEFWSRRGLRDLRPDRTRSGRRHSWGLAPRGRVFTMVSLATW